MRRSHLQYWSVILLVLLRLAFGPFADAVSHVDGDNAASLAVAASPSTAHCADRVSARDAAHLEHDLTPDQHASGHVVSDHPAGLDDCCANGACDCPCVYGTAFLFPRLLSCVDQIAVIVTTDSARASIDYRPDGLFRPPA